MLFPIKAIFLCGTIALAITSISPAADLSPANWPQAERERLEKLENQSMSPLEAQIIEGNGGIISATVSPVAVHAGIQALKLGGNAADAAATTALTQITTQLGSVVSYAGVFTMLYYDAKEHKVYSMDAGYNSYLHETDPASIPVSDLGSLPVKSAPMPTVGGARRDDRVKEVKQNQQAILIHVQLSIARLIALATDMVQLFQQRQQLLQLPHALQPPLGNSIAVCRRHATNMTNSTPTRKSNFNAQISCRTGLGVTSRLSANYKLARRGASGSG